MADEEIIASMQRRGIGSVKHFIDLKALPNVMVREGLWCAQRLREWGDTFDDDRHKWGSWAKGEEFSGYISCSINNPMGMMKRSETKRPVIIRLDPALAAREGVLLIGKWSSFGDVALENCVTSVGAQHFEAMFEHPLSYRAIHPGEILVPEHIPISDFRQLVFYDKADLEEAREILSTIDMPTNTTLNATVDRTPFGYTILEEGSQ